MSSVTVAFCKKMAFHYFLKKTHNHKDDLIKCYDLLSLLDATEQLHANIACKYADIYTRKF